MTTSTGTDTTWRRGFWSLIITQFQGAFSDNALKWLAIFLIMGMNFSQDARDRLVGIVGALFAIPFIVFSMAGGFLADRYSKRAVTIGVKVFEIGVMLLALAGLALNFLPVTVACVFLMGVHSAIFGPSKYGLLPELLPEKRLSWGNGLLELGTFMAIILGTVTGAWLCQTFAGRQGISGGILVALAIVGLGTSFGITRVPPADPARKFRLNFLGELAAQVRRIRPDRVLRLAVWGNIYFSFLGALAQFMIVLYGKDVLHASDTQTSLLQAATAVGIGLGSFAAGYLSGGKIEYGLIPLGSLGMTAACALLVPGGLSFNAVAVRLAVLGFFGGFFIVPISAIMQHRPDKERKGGILAAANLLSFVGIFAASGVYYLLTAVAHLGPHGIFALCAGATLAGTVYVLWLVPDSFLRLVLWMFTHSIYRIRIDGRDHIPERGGALFVCNHVSFVDALLLMAATDRPLRPIVFKGIYDLPIVKPFLKLARAIPISSQLRPREMIKALQEASDAIRHGEVILIFAEGQITRIGQLLPFRRGFERIMKDVDAPIIPVCLDNVWGSIFSFEKGRFLWKVPRYFPYPVTVSFGAPLPATAKPFEVRQAVQDLNADAWHGRRRNLWPLHRAFIRKAHRHRWRFFMADARTPRLNFGAALTRTIFLARRLRAAWHDQPMVGILLPPSVGGALVNYAALLLGKVPVNLNYTANDAVLASCAQQCNLKTIITSREFLTKLKLNIGSRTGVSPVHSDNPQTGETPVLLFLEDLAANPRLTEKVISILMSWLLPPKSLERTLTGKTATLDDFATIIFSSGSTGDPKGVMLTHWNVRSNIEQLGQTFAFNGRDRILGILPFFHSFGFTGSLMAPAVLGFGVVFHPSPLDAKAIGALVRDYNITFLLATPTFLQLYLRLCEPEDFGSVQFAITGAEKLPERLATAFDDKFGLRPLEAYGLTECSPAVAVNTHDFRAAGFRQVGAKRGKIGHPLPGIAVRIVDPDSFQPVPVNQPGLLLIRGPNVMQGYLSQPEKNAAVIRDGWYVTGDIAAIDDDGFLTITDRLTRFSKIGGEMVPHIKVEEKLHELAGATEQCFTVTGVPDQTKGERLVVLHTLPADKLAPVVEKLTASDLPNLWKPRPDQFFQVDALPYLGTGKLDLRKIKEMAIDKSS